MIRNDSCPDDKLCKNYFKQLKQNRFNKSGFFFGNKLTRELAISQNHTCPMCDEILYNGEKLHRHHIIPFVDNGPTTFANLVLIHLPCHNNITFIKDKEEFARIQEFLLEYKQTHPSLLSQYIKGLKKFGLTKDEITENMLSEIDNLPVMDSTEL